MSTRLSLPTTFRKKLYLCIAVFSSLIIFFSVSLIFDGPRIRKVEFDTNKVTRETNQTIVLRSNQPIKSLDKSQVSITPSVDFSITTSGEAVILQLKQRLDYDTGYSIKLKDMQSDNGKTSSYDAKIKTGSAGYFYLKRNGLYSKEPSYIEKEPDQIIKGSFVGVDEVVYSAHQIVDFVKLEDSFVISQIDEYNEQSIVIYDAKTKEIRDISLPDIGTVQNLEVSPNKKLFGFTFTSDKQAGAKNDYQQRLFVYDVVAKLLVPMRGIGEDYIETSNWQFAPDGTTIIASTYKTGMTLIDSYSKNAPIPLGSYYDIGNFNRTGSKVALSGNSDGYVVLDLVDNKKIIPKSQEVDGVLPYITGVRLLQNSNNLLNKIQIIGYSGSTTYATALVVNNGDNDKTVFKVNYKETDLLDYSSSGNDQYVTVETSEAVDKKQYDNYPENPRPTNTQTQIVDMKDGKTLKTIDGFMLTWE